MSKEVVWCGPIGPKDDFGQALTDEFIDGKTRMGPWGIMTPHSWKLYGGTNGRFGTGLGQRYEKQSDGRWLKVEG